MTFSRTVIVIVMVIVGVGATLPTLALAAFPNPYWGPLVSCGPGAEGPNHTPAPQTCTSLCDLLHTGQNVLNFSLTLVLFIIAPIIIVVGGFMVALSAGNPTMLTQGKKTVTGAAIGILITLGAYLIVATFLWATGAATLEGGSIRGHNGVPWPTIQCGLR